MYYEIHGRQDPGAPTVLLSSGLGGAAHYWTPQIGSLGRHFRLIAYDHYGTGKSPGALPERYSIADMATEAAALLDDLGVERCHFIGHALGGLIGLCLALHRPSLISRLAVVNAWAKTHQHTVRCFAARRSLLLNTGPSAYVQTQPLFLYPAWWLADRQDWLAEQDAAGVAHFPPLESLLRRIDAILAFNLEAAIPTITIRTLVIAAQDDVLVPSTCSQQLAGLLPDGKLVTFEAGGHACNMTVASRFNATVATFLTGP